MKTFPVTRDHCRIFRAGRCAVGAEQLHRPPDAGKVDLAIEPERLVDVNGALEVAVVSPASGWHDFKRNPVLDADGLTDYSVGLWPGSARSADREGRFLLCLLYLLGLFGLSGFRLFEDCFGDFFSSKKIAPDGCLSVVACVIASKTHGKNDFTSKRGLTESIHRFRRRKSVTLPC